MRHSFFFLLMLVSVVCSCKKQEATEPSPITPVPTVLLKDIQIPRLPSPFYHFQYNDKGEVSFVSFASSFTMYDVLYNGGKISEMKNNNFENKDRLQYNYDNRGRVIFIQYTDSAGIFFAESFFTYDEKKLLKAERFIKQANGTIVDRVMTMQYDADDNLADLTIYRPPVNGSVASTTVDHFEQYDTSINVDGFDLLHPDFFEHFFLLPGVQLQKNNPGRLTRTGDGAHFQIDFTYNYNSKNIPLVKHGRFEYLTGPSAGLVLQETTNYSYY